jgi:enoyl-CoA hydratase/carnithine racemase
MFKSLKSFSTKTRSPLVSFEIQNSIGLITLLNSKKRNALNKEILNQLTEDFSSLENSSKETKTPRVVILAAEGPVFSSGHDLKELKSLPEDQQKEIFTLISNLMLKIQNSSSIVIAEVQGLATAAGCQLAATCDLIIASNKSKFETPGVKVGLFCSTPSVAVSRCIGSKRAMQMLVTGEPIDAQTAKNWGLINEVIENNDNRDELRKATLKLAEHINQFSGEALSFGKKVFYTQNSESSIEEAYKFTSVSMCCNLNFKDAKEGISAFLEKRKPEFNKH